MKEEIKVFFTALMFFTRIPVPQWVNHSQDYLNKSTRYFPFVGMIVGTIGALSFWLSTFMFNQEISVLLSMVATILVTGAFHEDGLADVCDGFGGGWTKNDILRIMKDSQIGTFGGIGLIIILLAKYLFLSSMNVQFIPLVLIASHAFSRYMAVTFILTTPYVRDEDTSKIKSFAGQLSGGSFLIATTFGCASLILLAKESPILLLAIIPVILVRIHLQRFFMKWIGGHTGDCAGATQQICEVIFYLSTLALWKFI